MRSTWTVTDSAQLTASLIVVDGAHMPASGLDEAELRATVTLAYRLQVRPSVVAKRIGWTRPKFRKWAKAHGCPLSEDDFPGEPLKWLTRKASHRIPTGRTAGGIR